MAKASFYMIYIERKKDITFEQVKEQMDHSVDWYRLNERLWIMYTTSNEDKWYNRLSKLVNPEGSLFIAKLDMDTRQGWMDESFWRWIRREDDED